MWLEHSELFEMRSVRNKGRISRALKIIVMIIDFTLNKV